MKSIQELMDLSGRTAVVTGGAKGIGQGICHRLAEAGATVVVADLDHAGALETAKELVSRGWQAEALEVDVSREDDVAAMISTCVDHHGSLDILVNNAGIFPSVPIAEIGAGLFDHVIQVNLRSVFLATKYAAEVMKRQGSGKIINVTSIDALHPSAVGLAHYDASKHGVWGFTKNSALELAPFDITVNAIAPGGITTPGVISQSADSAAMAGTVEQFLAKIPMHRMGDPDEIGMVALFLASEMSSYMTGAQIVVDGGALLA